MTSFVGDPKLRLLRAARLQPLLEFRGLLQDQKGIPILENQVKPVLGELPEQQFFHVVHTLAAGH